MITKNQIIEIILRPYGNLKQKSINKVMSRFLKMDEQEFIEYAQTIIPNRYYLS